MKFPAQILPGLKYGFTITPDPGHGEHCLDFYDDDGGSRICHVRLRLYDRTLVVNHFIEGTWGPEEGVVLPPDATIHRLHVRFGDTAATVTCDGITVEMTTHCHKVYEKISSVDLRGFVATPGLLGMELPGGESVLDLNSLEYAILEARVIRLEARLAAMAEQLAKV